MSALRQHDQRLGAAGDQALDVRELLRRRGLGVGGDVGAAGLLDGGLDRRLVGLPALLLEVGPASDSAPSTWGEWAGFLDLLPVKHHKSWQIYSVLIIRFQNAGGKELRIY